MKDVRLRSVAQVSPSNVDKKAVKGEVPVQLCNYTDVYYNDFIHSGLKFMSATATPHQIRSFSLDEGDVLITKDSETPDDIAVPALVIDDMFGVLCGYHLAQIRPNLDRVDARFLFRALSSGYVNRQFAVAATGITRYGLRTDAIRDARIPLPNLVAQRLIADFLDRETERIDTVIGAKRRLIGLLAEKRTALITHAVTKGLDPTVPMKDSGIPWIGGIPAHWGEALLNKVARMGSGHTPSRSRPDWWVDCTIPWITTGEVAQIRDDKVEYVRQTREKVSVVGLANSSAVVHPAETVFLSRTASAGFSGIMAVDMATSQDFVTWTCGKAVLPQFVLLCLRSMRRDLLERLAQGSTHQTIYMPDVSSIQIPIPPVEEQQRIVEHFWSRASKLDKVADALSAQLRLLSEYRQALITAAVTGQLDEQTLKGRKPADEALGVGVPS